MSMRCPDCGITSTPDDNYCECSTESRCAECTETFPLNVLDEDVRHCWEHITDFPDLIEYCHQRQPEIDAGKETIVKQAAYIKELEDKLANVRLGLYSLFEGTRCTIAEGEKKGLRHTNGGADEK